MHTRDLIAAAIAFSLGLMNAPMHAQTPKGDDREKILGVWSGGMPGEPKGSIELVITPTTISGRNARTGKSLGEGTYDLDPANKTIDARGIENPVRGRTYIGLYSLDGNTLRWCANSRSKKASSLF
jgi:uncharacterized protein (TIGR03067 family)